MRINFNSKTKVIILITLDFKIFFDLAKFWNLIIYFNLAIFLVDLDCLKKLPLFRLFIFIFSNAKIILTIYLKFYYNIIF